MKRFLIIPLALLFTSGLLAQGIVNKGGTITVGTGAVLTVSGTDGNYLNESSGANDAAIDLSGTLKISGNFTNNVAGAGIFSSAASGSEVIFNGTGTQTLGGSSSVLFTFPNLTLNNSGGGLQLGNHAYLNGDLTLTQGLFGIGSYNLTLSPSSSVLGTPSASAMVVPEGTGEMRKEWSGTGSFLFPVGDVTGTTEYSPVTLSLTAGTPGTGAYTGLSLVNAKYPLSLVNGTYLTRYWKLTGNSFTGLSADALFQYTPGDVNGTEANITCVRVLPTPQTNFDQANTTLHQLTANGLTELGTFTGENSIIPSVASTDQEGCAGYTPADLTATAATGCTETFTYQWQSSTDNLNWSDITDETSLTLTFAAPLPVTTYFRIVSTDLNCGSVVSNTVTITVYPFPSVTNANTKSICDGSSTDINLTASVPSTFTWTVGTVTGEITGASSGSGASIDQVLSNPSNSQAGTVDYIVTPTSDGGSCEGTPYTITVTVNPSPSVTTANTATTCSGTGPGISLTASVSSSFSWTVGTITGSITGATSGSGSSINQSLTNPSHTTAGTVEYLVTPTSTAGSCDGAAYTITVTVNPAPAVTNAATATICSGTSTNLSLEASVPSNFSWTIGTNTGSITGASSGSGSTIDQSLTNPSSTTAGSVEYIVTPVSTSGTCTGAAFTITVTVNPKPVVTNANTASTCSGTGPGISLTASVPSSFTWTVGNISGSITGASSGSGSSINQTLTNPSHLTAGTVEYRVTPTSTTGSCTGAAYTITVTVYPAPAVTTANTATTCSGTGPGISLTASVASSFTWTIGNITGSVTGASSGSGSSINQTLTNPSHTTAGTVEYLVTPTSTTGSCTGAAYTITVTVNPAPAVTNAANATICSGTSTNLSLEASVPSNFSWTIGDVTGSVTGATSGSGSTLDQTLINPSSTTAGSVEYIVTPVSTSGTCTGAAFTITVTVNPKPVVTNANTASTCSGTGPGISLTASVPSSFTWTVGNITGSVTGASSGSGSSINQTLTNPSHLTAGTVEYLVTPTSTTGSCTGAAYTITVTVNPAPAVTTANTATTCSGTGPGISLTASVASSFTWTIGNITGSVTGASSGSGSSINQTLTNPSHTTAGTVEYLVTPTSTTGSCTGAAYTITVTVDPAPAVTIAATASICSGTSTNLSLEASVPSNFSWTIGDITGLVTGAASGSGSTLDQTLTNPSHTTAGTVEYIVTPVSTTGTCTGAPFTITVTVNPAPEVTTANTASVCSGSGPGISLTASIPSSFSWTVGTITGSVTGASAGSGSSIDQALTNPSHTTAGSVQYIVTPTSTDGSCTGAAYTITVTVNPTPVVTNSATASICGNTNVNLSLTASTPSTFSWTIGTITGSLTGAEAGSGSTISQVLDNVSHTTAATVEYLVTPTSETGSCAGPEFTITVTVNPSPEVTSASTAAICSESATNISLTASLPSSFAWTLGANPGGITGATAGSGSTIAQTLTNPSSTTAATIEYLVTPTATTGSCVGLAYTITVTVNPVMPVSVSIAAADNPICPDGTVDFTATPVNGGTSPSYQWKVNNVNAGTNSATFSYAAANNDVVTCVMTSNAICYTGSNVATSSPVTVTYHPFPTPAISGLASACTSHTETYTTESGMTSYSWNVSAGGTITSGSGTNTVSVTWNTIGSQSVSVNYTNANGCTALAATSYPVTVLQAPVPTITGSPTACAGIISVQYTTETGKTGYSWTVSSGGAITFNSGRLITVRWTGTGPQWVAVNYSNPNGCTAGTPTQFNVTVNERPAPTISGSNSTCQSSTGNTYTTETGMSGYSWTITGGTITSGAGTSSVNVTWNTTGAQWIRVNYTNALGCPAISPTQLNVTVNPVLAASVSMVADANPVCAGTLVTFTATPTNGGTTPSYQWYNGSSPVGTDSPTFAYTPLDGDVISVVMTSNAVCVSGSPANSATVTMSVIQSVAAAGAITGTTSLTPGATAVPYSVAAIANATSYVWAYSGTGATITGNGTASVTIDFAANATSGTLSVYGSNTCGDGTAATLDLSSNKSLAVTVYLEGPYNTGSAQMNTTLNTGALIPLSQPYTAAPWNYAGTESVTSIPTGVVDWVLVELRDAASAAAALPATTLPGWPKAFFLKADGSIVDLDGVSAPNIGSPALTNSLFVVIRHRNHLAIMSGNAIGLTGLSYNYNFTTSITQAYGGAAGYKSIGTGVYGMVAADIVNDGQVVLSDFTNWASNGGSTNVYNFADVDLNGQVVLADFTKWATNGGTSNILLTPSNTKYECQVPGTIILRK
jgi:large repetitive protein